MSKEKTKWEKANISYINYMNYISSKHDRYELTLIDLLFVSNFKGGNASINEKDATVTIKLKKYSQILIEASQKFGQLSLVDLTDIQLVELKKITNSFLGLTEKDSLFCIDGFKSSYTSALLHFYFPNLIPILDRRVLNGAGIKAEMNKQGQVIKIERYYSQLIDKFYSDLRQRKNITLRNLDKEYFIRPINK